MKHHLTFKDAKSDKFWQIETSGKSFTVTYGKAGTTGISQTKKFNNEEKCFKEAEKLVKEKLKKGYVELSEVVKTKADRIHPEIYLEIWKTLTSTRNLSKALATHFSFLAETPSCNKIVVDLFKKADHVEIVEDKLKITFSLNKENDEASAVMICEKPYVGDIHPSVPPSLIAIVRNHNGITWEGSDVPFVFNGIDENGVSSSLPSGFIKNDSAFMDKVNQKGLDINAIVAPITNSQDWYIFNPLIESCHEPALCEVSHNDGLVKKPVTTQWNFKGTFLRLLASFALEQVNWSHSTNEVVNLNFAPQFQIKRYIKKAVIDGDKLFTIQTKITADLLSHYPGSGNQIAIYDLKTGMELSHLMLEVRPFDIVVSNTTIYVFCVSYGKTENKFLLNSYIVSASSQIIFDRTLDETVVKEHDFPKCGTNDVANQTSIFIHDNALMFFFFAFKDRKLKGHEIKVFDITSSAHRFTYKFPETFVRSVREMDGKLFCEIELKKIVALEISGTTFLREPWGEVETRGIFCVIRNYVYAQIDFEIAVFNKQGERLFSHRNPDSMGIEYLYGSGNVLLVDSGFFYYVQDDGQLVPIKSNLKSKIICNHHEKIIFTERYLCIQREFHNVKPEKEILFEVYRIEG